MTKCKEKICDGGKTVLSRSKFNTEKKFDWSTLFYISTKIRQAKSLRAVLQR